MTKTALRTLLKLSKIMMWACLITFIVSFMNRYTSTILLLINTILFSLLHFGFKKLYEFELMLEQLDKDFRAC